MYDFTMSRLMGFLYGDGWCSHNKNGEYYEVGFQQSLANQTIYNYYKNLILSIHNGYYRERIRNSKLELIVYSKQLFQLIKDLKNNPIKHFKLHVKEAFIAGFTDSDGYVSRSEVALYNKNLEPLREIMTYLSELSINSKISSMKHIWRLRVRGYENVKLFLKFIPTLKKP